MGINYTNMNSKIFFLYVFTSCTPKELNVCSPIMLISKFLILLKKKTQGKCLHYHHHLLEA